MCGMFLASCIALFWSVDALFQMDILFRLHSSNFAPLTDDTLSGCRLPVHMHELLNRYFKVSKELSAKLMRRPTQDELCAEMKVDSTKLEEILEACKTPYSMDGKLKHDSESSTLGDLLQVNLSRRNLVVLGNSRPFVP